LLASVTPLSGEQLTRDMGNSFGSVRDTVAHILGAEWIWLERWLGRSPKALLAAADFPTVATISERWASVEQDRNRFIQTLTPAKLQETVAYINTRGEPYSYLLWQQMVHVANHSTYHRGQVTTLLRQLCAEPQNTDFLTYYDVEGKV
jgi:uncharacterized damage-inducible protein DinB